MKSRIATLSASEDSQPACVTILYEDLAAALRAHIWFECLTLAGRVPADLQTEFWRFDYLNEAAQRKAAVKMATRSSLVVVAARDQSRLTADVECCINAWLQNQGTRPGGLALLLASPEHASTYTRLTLARWRMVASEQRVNVYCDLPEWRLDGVLANQNSPRCWRIKTHAHRSPPSKIRSCGMEWHRIGRRSPAEIWADVGASRSHPDG